jgi:LacI family transcriptional regulator
VGLLTNDLEGRFVIPILAGVEDALGAGEISVILCDSRGDAIRERRHLNTLLERRIDGLIVVGGAHTEPRPSLGRDLGVPVVYVYAPSADPHDISIVTDNIRAGRLAAEHLWECGRRNIAYIGGESSFIASSERASGVSAALAELGSGLVANELNGDWSEHWGRAATTKILQQHPEVDGIVAASDILARAVLDILRDHDKRVPDDVSVVGFDNWGVIVTNTRPTLTSVDLRLEELGRAAAFRLFSAIAGEAMSAGVEQLPVQLCVRASSRVQP